MSAWHELVEREHEAEVSCPPLDSRDGGARAEVVGRAGVGALLGAARDQPDVAGGLDRPQPRRERDERADPGRVVVGTGRGRRDRSKSCRSGYP